MQSAIITIIHPHTRKFRTTRYCLLNISISLKLHNSLIYSNCSWAHQIPVRNQGIFIQSVIHYPMIHALNPAFNTFPHSYNPPGHAQPALAGLQSSDKVFRPWLTAHWRQAHDCMSCNPKPLPALTWLKRSAIPHNLNCNTLSAGSISLQTLSITP